MAEYSIALEFDTDDEQFARGFEAGRVWALLQNDRHGLMVTVHKSNAEMLLRIAEATNRKVVTAEFSETEDEQYDHLIAEFTARPVEA